MLNDLLLLSKNDIPFPEGQLVIHTPTIKEIGLIGEENFFMGCEMLNFSKDNLNIEDKSVLEQMSDFDILMQIMLQQDSTLQKTKISVYLLFSLLFPNYQMSITQQGFTFVKEEDGKEAYINNKNFSAFKELITKMFCLQKNGEKEDYNPGGDLARQIADKLKKRHQKLAELSGSQKISIFSRYISILSIGMNIGINELLEYSVYQLFDTFTRYELKISYDTYVQAKMAGAKDIKDPDNWMKDIHS